MAQFTPLCTLDTYFLRYAKYLLPVTVIFLDKSGKADHKNNNWWI